jgi:hypothetical protein
VADYNKNVANKTYEIPGYNGASGSYLSGYRIVVNKKEYGKFSSVSFLSVSPDEKNVFAICTDMKAGQLFLVNDKKINLQQKGFSGIGKMLASPDGNKAVYLELKQKSAAEMEKDMKDYEHAKYVYRGLKSDGTGFELTVTGNLGDADFKMANNGAVVYVNSKTGEIFTDGKPAGKFIFNNNESDGFSAETLLIGDTPDKICYYASDGSLNYPGGIKKDMGIIFPAVIRLSGKTYISWFRQCNNEIYIGKMIF